MVLLAVGLATPMRRAMSVVRASPFAAIRAAISSVECSSSEAERAERALLNRSACAGSAASPAGPDGGSLPRFMVAKSSSLAPPRRCRPSFHCAALAAKCNRVSASCVLSSLCAHLQPIDYDVAKDTLWRYGGNIRDEAMSDAVARVGLGLTDRTVTDIRNALAGRTQWRSPLLFAGPAVVASIAYMDPGNFATNIGAGARYGYALLWVVLTASLAAMLFQSLSAKLGIVTGRNLAELCREHFPKPVVWALWIVSEIAAMATDLAEFLGGAIGLSLLLHIPLLAGMGVTGVLTYGILMFEGRGFRPTELIIGTLVAAIALCYLAEMVIAPVDWAAAGLGSVVPTLPDAGAVTIAVGIVGATIMPHAIFLHSGLTQNRAPARNDRERRLVLRFSNIEVLVALGVAGLVNMAMVIMASSGFHAGHSDVAEIGTAYKTLTPLLGPAAAGAFLTALLASGLASSTVGTMAGQMIMQGFVGFRVPIIVRRLVTMIPAFVVVWLGVNSTSALIMSQVVLSIALPAPVIALLIFTSRKDIMGAFANSRLTNVAASFAALVILTLNAVLLLQAFGVSLPGLPTG